MLNQTLAYWTQYPETAMALAALALISCGIVLGFATLIVSGVRDRFGF